MSTQNPQLLYQGYEGSVDLRPDINIVIEAGGGSIIINSVHGNGASFPNPNPDGAKLIQAVGAPSIVIKFKNPA